MVYFILCTNIFPCISSHNCDLALNHNLCSTVVSLRNTSFLKSPGFTVVELCTCYSVCWYLYNWTEKSTLRFSYLATSEICCATNSSASIALCFTGNLQAWENKRYSYELVYKVFLMEMMQVGRPAESLLLFFCIQIGLRNTETLLFILA